MIINANNIVAEFNQADMEALVHAYPLGQLQYRNYFPLEFSPNLTFASLETTGSAKVMADIVAIGSKAPRKAREFVESIKGEIPKIEVARDMTEKDLHVVRQLRQSVAAFPNSAGIKNQFINKVYEDQPFVIDGVNSRMEWMAKQIASQGSFTTSVTNNAGGTANVKVDFKVTIKNAAKDWYAAADADPIEELRAEQKAARALGHSYANAYMEQDTLDKVLSKDSTKQYVLGVPLNSASVLPRVTLAQVNALLAAEGLPTIVVWESFVASENKAGAKTPTTGWVQGNIHLAVESTLGRSQYTTTDEFNMNFPDTMTQTTKDEFILVKSFGHQDPISISTKATAFALPVLNNAKKNLILKTKLA